LRVLLIVVVSIGVLIALVIGGVFVFFAAHAFGSLSPHAQSDDAATAAKIANFTLPPGYRYASAMDMILLDSVVIEPKARPRAFTITLQGVASAGAAGDDSTEKAVRDGLGRNRTCTSGAASENVHLTNAEGTPVVLEVLHCTRNGRATRIEFGRVPGKLPTVVLIAAGSLFAFDESAVKALVGSMH
jgi:hypothetical protein